MSDKTIPEIKEAFARSGASTLNRYHERLAEIAQEREPEAGGYLERLTDEQRASLLREQKTERAGEITQRAREDYAAEVERYHAELSKRAGYLKGRLFKVEAAGALSRAALATDAELGAMLELAAHAGNAELGRAVFVASEQRGLGNLMAAFFDRIDPECRELYEEYAEIPPPEILERQTDSVETLIPEPDPERLMLGFLARATT
jgi:hypothetical protein